MNKTDVDSYRNQLDQDISKTFKEIDTNISYIIVGALGFFITMLDRFINIKHALLIICMFASFAFLLTSFILFLRGKHLQTRHSLKILTFVDNNFISKPEDEVRLNNMWEEANKKINRNRNWIYCFLGFGVVLQVVFFSVNIFFRNKQDSSEPIKVEIVGKKEANTNPNSTTVIKVK
jgi:hypothetical protein